jgi:hypothetical protein
MSEFANDFISGRGAASISSCGFDLDSTAKKKSGPRPAQAVPSFNSLASKVVVIASRNPGPGVFASSISWVAVDFSAASAGHCENGTNIVKTAAPTWSDLYARFFMGCSDIAAIVSATPSAVKHRCFDR